MTMHNPRQTSILRLLFFASISPLHEQRFPPNAVLLRFHDSKPPHLLHAFYPASASKPETYNLNHEPRAVRNQAISKGSLEQITAWGMRRGKPHLTDDLRLSCLTKIVRNSFANETKRRNKGIIPASKCSLQTVVRRRHTRPSFQLCSILCIMRFRKHKVKAIENLFRRPP